MERNGTFTEKCEGLLVGIFFNTREEASCWFAKTLSSKCFDQTNMKAFALNL